MVGGALMVVVGLLYLVLEDFVLADFTWEEKPTTPNNHVSRTLVGIQIGLTILSMVVTRSSALSLQAKQGLPPGNQLMGWIVLGKSTTAAAVGCRQAACKFSSNEEPTR